MPAKTSAALLAHRLQQRVDVALERVLLDERRLLQIRDTAEDLVLIGRQIDLVVHADRDRLRLLASRRGRGPLFGWSPVFGGGPYPSRPTPVLVLVESRAGF